MHVEYPNDQFWNEYLAAKAYTEKLKAEFGDDYKHEIDIKRKNSGFWGNAPQKGFLVRLIYCSLSPQADNIIIIWYINMFYLAWSQFCIQYHKRQRKIVPSIQSSMFGGNPRKEKVSIRVSRSTGPFMSRPRAVHVFDQPWCDIETWKRRADQSVLPSAEEDGMFLGKIFYSNLEAPIRIHSNDLLQYKLYTWQLPLVI